MSLTKLDILLQRATTEEKSGEVVEVEKRKYNEIAELSFAEDPEFAIKETDSMLLRFLKHVLIEGGYKYSDLLGQQKIVYSTFYNIKRTGRINFEMFERFMNVIGEEFEIKWLKD